MTDEPITASWPSEKTAEEPESWRTRRFGSAEEAGLEDILLAGDLEIRPRAWLALASGRAVMLTVREFQLLVAFARRQGAVVPREELYEAVWGRPLRPGDRAIDVYVRRLRIKLEAALPQWRFIHTHFGFGYRFAPERSQA